MLEITMRVPSSLVLCGGTLFFLLYLLPWHSLPSITVLAPSPAVPAPQRMQELLTEEEDYPEVFADQEVLSEGALTPYHENSQSGSTHRSSDLGLVPYRAIIHSGIKFNASKSDMLVLLHIQKTGGTAFEKHIVQDLDIEQPCICWKRKKRCKCPRPGSDKVANKSKQSSEPWLFSRFATGWVCGLHADWTELSSCVDPELSKAYGSETKRRYFYMTMIRDPIHRFLSEFRHVQRGATWRASRHSCDGRFATARELGSCYDGRNWQGVTLHEFLSCPHNMGFNRQTRMLADLSIVGCYNRSIMPEEERNRLLLASAKHNLETMSFVGLTEYQRISQYVFEETFGVRFKSPFTQNEDTYSKSTLDKATAAELELVRLVNALDLELYSFAEQLLHSRFKELKALDVDFEDHYNYLGEGNGKRFSWDEVGHED